MALFEEALETQVQERQRFLKEVTTVIVTSALRMQPSTFKKHNLIPQSSPTRKVTLTRDRLNVKAGSRLFWNKYGGSSPERRGQNSRNHKMLRGFSGTDKPNHKCKQVKFNQAIMVLTPATFISARLAGGTLNLWSILISIHLPCYNIVCTGGNNLWTRSRYVNHFVLLLERPCGYYISQA